MRSRQHKRLEEPVHDRELGERWVETIKTPIIDAEDRVIGTAGIARDITARKQADQALRTIFAEPIGSGRENPALLRPR